MSIKSGINWRTSIVAVALLCVLFSFTATAQTEPDEPLDAEAASALVQELSDGLPDLIDDEAAVATITENWGKRQDLAGKTRSQILKMIFGDVKSVIHDKETQDNIWKSWAVAEKSKDETPVETPKPPAPVETPKPAIWVELFQNGAYVARFNLTWDEPNKPNNSWDFSGQKTAGFRQRIDLPNNATNVRLRIEAATGLVWDPWGEVINKVLQPNELNRCYRSFGTTLNRQWDNNCP